MCSNRKINTEEFCDIQTLQNKCHKTNERHYTKDWTESDELFQQYDDNLIEEKLTDK